MSNKSKRLSLVLILAIALVALAIIFTACRFVDSLHKDVQDARTLSVENASSPKDQSIDRRELENNFDLTPNITDDALSNYRDHLSGSEIIYQKGLDAFSGKNFKEGVFCFSEVLRNIPLEARSRTRWLAAGKSSSKDLYTAYAYQGRAICYLPLRKYKEGIADLSLAIALRPDYPVNYVNRGKAYYLTHQKNLGDADMAKARALAAQKTADN